MIVYGKSEKGGTLARQADLLARASKDLESKLGGKTASALAVYEDDAALYLVASVDSPPAKEEEKGSRPKGGR